MENIEKLKPLNVKRTLSTYTREKSKLVNGKIYAVHYLDDEVIVTDNHDFSKIYSITSLSFFNEQKK